MCDIWMWLYAWLRKCCCVHLLTLVCVHGAVYICMPVYCIAGALSQLAMVQPPGGSASSCGEHRHQKMLCALRNITALVSPQRLLTEIINELQIHRVMMGVTAPIGKLFLLTRHFFCLCFCLSQYFVLIIRSVTSLVHTAVETFLVAIFVCK